MNVRRRSSGVVLPLDVAVPLELIDDLADDGLGPVEVDGRFSDGQWPGLGQVQEHRPGCSTQLVSLAVPPVEGEVCRGEQLAEPPHLGSGLGDHAPTVEGTAYIVNPDGM
jgi:hypothetical protein